MFVKFNTSIGGQPREVYLNPAHVLGVVCNTDGSGPIMIRTVDGDIAVGDLTIVQVVERLSGRGLDLHEPAALPETSVLPPAENPTSSENLS